MIIKSLKGIFETQFCSLYVAEVAELVDALDSKSSLAQTKCRFESGLRYMYYLYAISSTKRNYIYVGITSNIERRLNQHNSGYNKTTKSYRPFELIYQEELGTRIEARKREKYFKSGIDK